MVTIRLWSHSRLEGGDRVQKSNGSVTSIVRYGKRRKISGYCLYESICRVNRISAWLCICSTEFLYRIFEDERKIAIAIEWIMLSQTGLINWFPQSIRITSSVFLLLLLLLFFLLLLLLIIIIIIINSSNQSSADDNDTTSVYEVLSHRRGATHICSDYAAYHRLHCRSSSSWRRPSSLVHSTVVFWRRDYEDSPDVLHWQERMDGKRKTGNRTPYRQRHV